MRQRHEDGETIREFVARVMSNCDYEDESLFDGFTEVAQLFEYVELWSVYDTDYFVGIMECISEGDDPTPYNNFVRKWKLDELPEYKWSIVSNDTAAQYM